MSAFASPPAGQQPLPSSSAAAGNSHSTSNSVSTSASSSTMRPPGMQQQQQPGQPQQQQQQQPSSQQQQQQQQQQGATTSAAARQQRALFKPFLHTMRGINMTSPSSTPGGTEQQRTPGSNASAARPQYQTIVNCETTPNEREIGRTSRSGRVLSEMEVLQEKHEPEFQRLMPVVAAALKDVVAIHEPLKAFAPPDEKYSYYETNAAPPITIDAYVQRISEYTYISPATLLASLVILDRLAGRHPTLLFTMLNVYKIFFVAVRIASKVVDLRTLNNRNFAPVGGISNRHLNDIEARMLIDLRFDLYISPADYRTYVRRATDGVPQPIAISSSFQGAMAQMQASQRAEQLAAQQRRADRQLQQQQLQQGQTLVHPNLPGGSLSMEGGLAVHVAPSAAASSSPSGGSRDPSSLAESVDQFSRSADEKHLPPNKNALEGPQAVAPTLNLGL